MSRHMGTPKISSSGAHSSVGTRSIKDTERSLGSEVDSDGMLEISYSLNIEPIFNIDLSLE